LDDLNGKVVIPYVGKVPGEYLFEAFYYHAGSPNVVVSIYEYTTAQMNSGSATGTLIGSFTTEAAPGYAVTLFAVNATASPAVWIPQTTSNDVYLKALL
jgi:glucose dehydrogenase